MKIYYLIKNGENLINQYNSYIERNFLNTGRSHTLFEILEFKFHI